MIILAIDSTEITVTAAVTENDRLLGCCTSNAGLTHSETLLPMTDALLKSARLSYDSIDLFACSAGPGSFTGVRIGAAMIKGLAFGRDKICAGLSSLEVLAYNFVGIDGIICPCMDARRSQLYNAIFESKDGIITRLKDDRVISADELATELADYTGRTVYFCGGGYNIIKSIAKDNPSVKDTPELLKYQSGYSAALCAYRGYKNSTLKTVGDCGLTPVYLRPSQAERTGKDKAAHG